MLADLALHPGAGAATYTTELAWREFYADVLWRSPESAREYLDPEFARMEYDRPGTASRLGAMGSPAIPSSTRACASYGPRAGCTTGSG